MHLNIKQLIILFPSAVCGVAFCVVFFGLLHLGHSEQQSWETKKRVTVFLLIVMMFAA